MDCVVRVFFNDNCLGFSRVQSFAYRLRAVKGEGRRLASLSLSLRIQTRRNLITRERGRSQSFARLLIHDEEGEGEKKDERVGRFLETRSGRRNEDETGRKNFSKNFLESSKMVIF